MKTRFFSASSHLSELQLVEGDDGQSVLLDIEHDRILSLNRVAAEMWRLMSLGTTRSEIVNQISDKYQVEAMRVAGDLDGLIDRINELQLAPQKSVSVSPATSLDSGNRQVSYPWYASPGERPEAPTRITLFAFAGLVLFDIALLVCSLKSVCEFVNVWPLRGSQNPDPNIPGKVCSAVEKACVWYPKQAMCLQRSAVTTCILRIKGKPAKMVIGIRPMPFMAHTWVEIDGQIVNDWRGVRTFYSPVVSC